MGYFNDLIKSMSSEDLATFLDEFKEFDSVGPSVEEFLSFSDSLQISSCEKSPYTFIENQILGNTPFLEMGFSILNRYIVYGTSFIRP